MDPINTEYLTDDEFVERFLNENDAEASMDHIVYTDVEFAEMEVVHTDQEQIEVSVNNNPSNIDEAAHTSKNGKVKRRSNLTAFTSSQTAKRKNECAKRELTSVVRQLGKIDQQLNTNTDTRVSINFVATFTSFNSNRQSTFIYPPDAKIKQTLLDHDTTILAVKNAVKDSVKEAWNKMAEEQREKGCTTDLSLATTSTDVLSTPTKTISAFTAFPSPVAIKGQPVSAKNLCAKNSCTFGKKTRKPVWVKCCHRNKIQISRRKK